MTKFPTTVGVEYTFTLNRIEDLTNTIGGNSNFLDLLGRVAFLQREDYVQGNEVWYGVIPKYFQKHAHEDCGVVEVPSPVFTSETEVESFYGNLLRFVNNVSLTPKYTRTIDDVFHQNPGGGGHVHLGLDIIDKSIKKQFCENATCLGISSPWINWLFNEWMDDDLATPTVVSDYKRYKGPEVYKHVRFLPIAPRVRHGTKRAKVKDTLEFRWFEAPTTVDNSILHIRFALATFMYLKKATEAGKKIPFSYSRIKDTSIYENTGLFLYETQKFFDLIQLDFAPYEKFLENYELRRESGILA